MKTAIDRVLAAEEDARRKVDDARQRAQGIVKNAETRGGELLDGSRKGATDDAEGFLRQVSTDAESAGRQIVEAAKARADKTLLEAEHLDLTFLAHDIDRITGIE